MDHYTIEGGKPLNGTIAISGAKNAALPLMAAALLTDGVTVLHNIPDLQDIRTMAMVLRVVGADVRLEDNTLTIDASHCNFWEAPYELVRKMRASFYVLGPLMARFGRARVSLPGGCALGPRPVDLHLRAMKQLGCEISIEDGYAVAGTQGLKGARIHLDISSVGATGNIMMAACSASGTTVIDNAACEPEIVDLADMLIEMGADIRGAGTKQVEIKGPATLRPVNWTVIPDRIEAGTFMIAAAATKSCITLSGCRSDHLQAVINKLTEAGVDIIISPPAIAGGDKRGGSYIDEEVGRLGDKTEITSPPALRGGNQRGGRITINATNRKLKAVDITTEAYPGFPTDLQAPWTALMCLAEGESIITETIYPERFTHVPELMRLGAQIRKKLNCIYVQGVEGLTGASVMCSDIRAGAAMVIAALAAKGSSKVLRIYHMDRGYERMEDKLVGVGADIRRVSE